MAKTKKAPKKVSKASASSVKGGVKVNQKW
jgi:hypothetical protein